MRFRFRKHQQPPSNAKRKSWRLPANPPPADNPDPAFSPDPRSHPYHCLTNHEWALPLAPGHPSLSSPQRRRRRAAPISRRPHPQLNDHNAQSDTTESEVEIIQPPNSPVSTSRSSTSDSNNNAGDAATERTALVQTRRTSPQPSSYPPLPSTSMSVQPPSRAKEDVKPEKRFGFFTKRLKQDSPGSKAGDLGRTILVKPQGRRSEENGPSSASRLADNPALQRHRSAPGPHRPTQRDLRPALGEQIALGSASRELYAAIGAVPSKAPAAITAHHQPEDAASNARSQVPVNLDKIDELDETAIFGARLHHDGPYEAANRAPTEAGFTSKSRMPLGLDYGRLHQYHERTMKAVGHVYMPPEVPLGVPLNLKPGQVLPRNFRRQAGKPPRLRNNMVSPLPMGGEVEEVVLNQTHEQFVIPPRHANWNEIPFHKSQVPKKPRPPRQLLRDNPLDGPPIDTSAIGLAMMALVADDDSPLSTPLPQPISQRPYEGEVQVEEFNPYAPESIGESSPMGNAKLSTPAKREESPPPAYTESGHPPTDAVSVMEFPTDSQAVESDILRTLSPSDSLNTDFAIQSLNGTSEETLVQDEGSEGMELPPDSEAPPTQAVGRDESHMRPGAKFVHESEQYALEVRGSINSMRAIGPAIEVETKAMDSVLQQASVTASKEPHSMEAQAVNSSEPMPAARYDKQLPPHPPSSPPLSDAHDQGVPSSSDDIPPATKSYPPSTAFAHPSAGREWKNSALQKAMAMHRDDLRRSTWSTTASQQSHSSTRVNDGHTPVPDTMSATSSSRPAPPQVMSRPSAAMKSSALDPLSTPLISRKDPVFNTDSLTRYPPSKPSLVSGTSTSLASGSSQEKRPYVIPAQRSRRNSTASSSAHSSILHTIHEEDATDPRPAQGLQRSQSSIQPRTMLQAKIQVGQVYPKHLQPSVPTIQRSITQLSPNHRPPAYTEVPQPSRASNEHRRDGKQALAYQPHQTSSTPEMHLTYAEGSQRSQASSSERRRRVHEQAPAVEQELRPLEIHVTNAGYDPRHLPQEKHDRSQGRSIHSSSSRSTPSSSRSGHSSSSTSHTTPDQGPHGGTPGDSRAQHPGYPFREHRDLEEIRGPSKQLSLETQLPLERERHFMSDDRRAIRAANSLSGVPEIDEGRRSYRQSYHQPYPERYPQDRPNHYAQLYPEIQDDRPYPRQTDQQLLGHYPQQQPQLYPQAEHVERKRPTPPSHAPEPSWQPEGGARPATDPRLMQPYFQQYPIQDNASSKPRSMNSSLTTSSVMPRYNPHLPKKLVMPAPLQAKSERIFNEVFDQPRPTPTPRKRRDKASGSAMPRPGVQAAPIRSREPTPSLVPPLLGNGHEMDPSAPAGRKLKKRNSYAPPPPAMSRPPPTKALNFANPTISIPVPSGAEKVTSHVKPVADKSAKKVLSKRRTNL